LKDVPTNHQPRRIGGFLYDSDEEDGEETLEDHGVKRRAIDIAKEPRQFLDGPDTPPASQRDTQELPTVSVEDLCESVEYPVTTPRSSLLGEEPTSAQPKRSSIAKTAAGKTLYIPKKGTRQSVPFEQLIAARSVAVEGRARRSYYGIDIHTLLDESKIIEEEKARLLREAEDTRVESSIEQNIPQDKPGKSSRTLMWTEKYRAKKFTDLVGDERTHRSVLRWLKGWDRIVFPGSGKLLKGAKKGDDHEEQRHRKVLLLTGPPGLGKTTMAHVCARQAGYEVQEINASDERSSNVVKGRIRDMVGTENVRGINTTTANGKVRKAGKPVCVVVDEVDGVVSGSGGGGEGGFIKALIDLINLDERNSNYAAAPTSTGKKKSRDKFRLLRPLILVCNDVYHPSLRPLRQSSCAEIIHIRKPALNMVVSRMHDIFGKEGILADSDGVRRLCEATWGVSTKKEGGTGNGTGEGDIRSVMVVGEWVAGRLRATKAKHSEAPRLTRQWVEQNIINDLGHGGGAARSLGRGGTKDVVDRVFREGAGFPKQAEAPLSKQGIHGAIGVAEAAKRRAIARLREMVDASGDADRIVSGSFGFYMVLGSMLISFADCFSAYPEKHYQDDTFLTKPNTAYDWLHFHDMISSQVHTSQEWELAPYLSQSVLAFHDLFASPRQQSSNAIVDPESEPTPFSGPGAAYAAAEARKAARAQLMGLQSTLSLPLTRIFRSPEELSLELLPYALRMLSPNVKPVMVNSGPSGSKSFAAASVRKASEKALVKKAVEAMVALGVRFEKSRVEIDDIANRGGAWILRMEPPLDQLASFETLNAKKDEKVRYAVRSVLDAEWKKESARMDAEARKRRGGQLGADVPLAVEDEKNQARAVKPAGEEVTRDFFGRVIKSRPPTEGKEPIEKKAINSKRGDEGRIWVSFNEGFSNAVRKPITLDDLMRGL
jgi:chromosome transmission fidelity protein 18